MSKTIEKTVWLGDSLTNLKRFPKKVRDSIGYSLYKVQQGITPKNAKCLKGVKPMVMEIVSDYDTNTYRAVYTVKISDVVYILHCFQKKSRQGIKTPKQEIDLIRQRLNAARVINESKVKSHA